MFITKFFENQDQKIGMNSVIGTSRKIDQL